MAIFRTTLLVIIWVSVTLAHNHHNHWSRGPHGNNYYHAPLQPEVPLNPSPQSRYYLSGYIQKAGPDPHVKLSHSFNLHAGASITGNSDISVNLKTSNSFNSRDTNVNVNATNGQNYDKRREEIRLILEEILDELDVECV